MQRLLPYHCDPLVRKWVHFCSMCWCWSSTSSRRDRVGVDSWTPLPSGWQPKNLRGGQERWCRRYSREVVGHFTVVASFIVEFGASRRGFTVIDCPSNSGDNLFDHRHIMFWSIFFVLVRHINLIICDKQIVGLLGGICVKLNKSFLKGWHKQPHQLQSPDVTSKSVLLISNMKHYSQEYYPTQICWVYW